VSELISNIKIMQGMVGAERDGVVGPETVRLVLAELSRVGLMNSGAVPPVETMDARSLKNLLTLDPKAQPIFREFYHLANATAATLGCSYILIGGNRTWEEQDALYAQGRTEPGERVTMAKGGQSNHNFGIAGDFGVFQGKVYLDGGKAAQQALASRVHKACSLHATACGLEWAGSWKSITDQPHYEVSTGLTMMQKRNVFKERGSVL
jgi:peptidoglycan L-alanyl-D-glutamate endopeptidase CwlK